MFYSMNEAKSNGFRRVLMETDKINRLSIQYVAKCYGDYRALITMTGGPQELKVLLKS